MVRFFCSQLLLLCIFVSSHGFILFISILLHIPLQNNIHQSTYGKSLAITTGSQIPNTIIENPEMLKFQQKQQIPQDGEHGAAAHRETQAPKVASMVNGESLEDIRKVLYCSERATSLQFYIYLFIQTVHLLQYKCL